MKKSMKKGMLIITFATICLMLFALSALAYDTGYQDFDTLANGDTTAMDSVISTWDNTLKRSGTVTPIKWVDQADATLKSFADEFGTSISVGSNNSMLSLRWGAIRENGAENGFETSFSIYADVNDWGYGKKVLMETFMGSAVGSGKNIGFFQVVQKNGTTESVTLMGQEVCTEFNPKTWYDIKLAFNPTCDYAQLSIKEHSATKWNVYDVFGDWVAKGEYPSIQRLNIMAQNGAKIYFDNYRTKSFASELEPALGRNNENFENDVTKVYGKISVSDYANQYWYLNITENRTLTQETAENVVGASGKVLKFTMLEKGNTELNKAPLATNTAYDNFCHDLKFKVGRGSDEECVGGGYTSADIWVRDSDGNLSEIKLFDIYAGTYVFYGATTSLNDIKLDGNILCDAEIVYDANKKILRLRFTDTAGKVHIFDYSDKAYLFNADSTMKKLAGIKFLSYCSADSYVSYFDEFKWNVLTDGFFRPVSAELNSANASAADMNESVLYAFNQSLLTTEEALEDIVVTVTSGGETVNPEYTLGINNGKLAVKFEELTPNTEYTVSVSGVKRIDGADPAKESDAVTFTTNPWALSIDPLTVTKTNTTVNAASAYSNGKKLTLIAAAYKGDMLADIEFKTIDINSRDKDAYSLSHTFDSEFDYVVSYLWSDLDTMVPYVLPVKSN